jgi:hypothetical protein
MLKTDVIYLGLTALAGVILYFQGCRHGVRKGRREQIQKGLTGKLLEPAWDQEETAAPLFFFRGRTTLARYHGRGVFGKN